MRADAQCPPLSALVSEGNHSQIYQVYFHTGKMHQLCEVSVPFLVRLYYQVWWWRMLYPWIDFLQVLILEIRRILLSAPSKQRTETVKTPCNSFQRKTTVMDYRLPWKWGNVLNEQREIVLIQGTLMKREKCPFSYYFPPFLPSLPSSSPFLSFPSFLPLPNLSHLNVIITCELAAHYYFTFYRWGN